VVEAAIVRCALLTTAGPSSIARLAISTPTRPSARSRSQPAHAARSSRCMRSSLISRSAKRRIVKTLGGVDNREAEVGGPSSSASIEPV
jgi:hypothetical protein